MQKSFILFFLIINIFSFAQKVDEILNERIAKVDSLTSVLNAENILSEKVAYLQIARQLLIGTTNDVLKLEDFGNLAMQKVLLKPLESYYEAFDYFTNGKKINTIQYGFERREDFILHYKIAEAFFLSRIEKEQFDALIKNETTKINTLIEYRDRNLKRLGVTISQYEKLSESDRKLLEEKFE